MQAASEGAGAEAVSLCPWAAVSAEGVVLAAAEDSAAAVAVSAAAERVGAGK